MTRWESKIPEPQDVFSHSYSHRKVPMNEARQLPSFHGWRAVAILLVLGSHSLFTQGFPSVVGNLVSRTFNGVLGVRFFFTISGFLITWLMVREESEAGSLSLKNFYIRRVLRILPVYLACLIATAFIQLAGISTQPSFIWIQLLTFTRNFYQTGHLDHLISAHFWSLSVEEQFYFAWPPVFLLLGRCSTRKRIGFLVLMVLFSIGFKIVALLGCYNRHLYFLFQTNSTFINLDCIAYGCIGAILLHTKEACLKNFFSRFSLWIFLLSCLLLLIPEIAGLGEGIQSFAFFSLLFHSVLMPEWKPFRLLNNRWMIKIGVLSYSLYIWQQLVLLLWPVPKLWFLAIPAAFFIAWLSYHFLEKPFFSLRAKFRRQAGG
jgi:peptidoglycan/LPS O-acetylase OafA/YrhL